MGKQVKRFLNLNTGKGFIFFLTISIFLIPFFWFGKDHLVAGGEIYALINPSLFLDLGFYAWVEAYLGSPNLYIITQPYHIYTYLISSIFTTSISQLILFGIFLSLSFLSFYSFEKTVFPKIEKKYLLIGSLFYIFNPFFVMMFSWVPAYGFLFVLTPAILKSILHIVEDNKINYKQFAYLSIYSFFLSVVALNLALFGLVFILILFIFIYELFNREKPLFFYLKRFFLIYLTIILANVFWILPFSQTYKSIYQDTEVYSDSLEADVLFDQPVLNAITLNEYFWFNKVDEEGNYFYPYNTWYQLPSKIILLIIAISIIALPILLGKNLKKNKYVLLFLVIGVIGIFLTKGSAFPLGVIYRYLLENITYFGIYRASDLKFPYFVVLSFSILLPFALSLIEKRINKNIIPIFLLGILFLGVPFISGDIFHKSSIVKIPSYWYSMETHLKNPVNNGRILVFPRNKTIFDNYSWGYNGAPLASQLFTLPSIHYNSNNNPNWKTNKLYNSIENGDKELFLNLLGNYNVTAILYRKDLINQSDNILERKLEELLGQGVLVGELTIWDISNRFEGREIYPKSITYHKVNPTKYVVDISNVSSSDEIVLHQAFDRQWGIYPQAESIQDNNIGQPSLYIPSLIATLGDISYIWRKPMFENQHTVAYEYANTWKVNKDDIGSDRIILFYRPQAYLILGYVITIIFLLGSIFYLLFLGIKRLNRMYLGRNIKK